MKLRSVLESPIGPTEGDLPHHRTTISMGCFAVNVGPTCPEALRATGSLSGTASGFFGIGGGLAGGFLGQWLGGRSGRAQRRSYTRVGRVHLHHGSVYRMESRRVAGTSSQYERAMACRQTAGGSFDKLPVSVEHENNHHEVAGASLTACATKMTGDNHTKEISWTVSPITPRDGV